MADVAPTQLALTLRIPSCFTVRRSGTNDGHQKDV